MRTLTLRLGFLLPSAILCLVFLPACDEPLPDADLLDNLWALESIYAPGEPIILAGSAARIVTLQFTDDGRLTGISFCNQYWASYELSADGAIEIGSILTTSRGCLSKELGHNEATYYQALPQVQSYQIAGHVLRLYFDDDSMMKYNLAE